MSKKLGRKPTERKIYLIGTIDEELYSKFTKELADLEREDKRAPVEVELSSAGGAAYDALAFYDRIRLSTCPIRITGYGLVASAAVLVLAAGHHRRMTSSSWLMVHEDSVAIKDKHVYEGESFIKHMRRMENQWCKLLEKQTHTDAKYWSEKHKATTYLTAKDCLELGIIDELLQVDGGDEK